MEITNNLNTVEIKAFIPSKDFELSKAFYTDLGFTMASEGGGVAYFRFGNSSFLLQDFYKKAYADNFTMHLLVEDVTAWYKQIEKSGIINKYDVKISDLVEQPWRMANWTKYISY